MNVQQLYEQIVSEYVEDEESELEMTEADARGIVQALQGKADFCNLEGVRIEDGPEDSYTVKVEGTDFSHLGAGESIAYDPSGEHCVTHQNAGTDVPPEGRTKDGNGDEVYGVR